MLLCMFLLSVINKIRPIPQKLTKTHQSHRLSRKLLLIENAPPAPAVDSVRSENTFRDNKMQK